MVIGVVSAPRRRGIQRLRLGVGGELVTDDNEELVRLRTRATHVGIPDSSSLSLEQLRRALAERERGLDPKQTEQEATGEQH